MWRDHVILLLLVVQLHCVICTSNIPAEIFRKYSTKTTYDNSVAQDDRFYNVPLYDTKWSRENCKPVSVVSLIRHGIRFPGEADITNIAKVIFKMKVAEVAASVVQPLESIANKFLITQAKDLAITGKKELHDLGKRFGKKVKKILPDVSSSSDFAFFSSSKSRAIGSCENFKEGFINATGLPFGIGTGVDDHLLRFFDDCSKYVVSVADNESSTVESSKFYDIYLPQINARLAQQLGVQQFTLNKDEIKSLLVIAGSEIAVFGSSNWAQLLSDEDLELLEYASDLKNYWKKGHGYSINYEPSCTLLRHMLQHIEDFITCRSKKKGVFYFGHTETIIPILSILGLFKDKEHLTADNYHSQNQRLFRTSRIAPFASNIAFVLNDCSTQEMDCSTGSLSTDRFFVRLLFKERPLAFPACGISDCPYPLVRRKYASQIEGCNFSELCWVGNHEEL